MLLWCQVSAPSFAFRCKTGYASPVFNPDSLLRAPAPHDTNEKTNNTITTTPIPLAPHQSHSITITSLMYIPL